MFTGNSPLLDSLAAEGALSGKGSVMWKVLGAIVLTGVVWTCLGGSKLPMAPLPKYIGSAPNGTAWVGGPCSRAKCLTVYVAPWCGVCIKMRGTIIALHKELEAEGIPVQIVIGMAKPAALMRDAELFPQTVALDDQGAFKGKAKIGAVPYFAVTNAKGQIEKDVFGGINDVQSMRSKLGI
jgi:hypothetical protein